MGENMNRSLYRNLWFGVVLGATCSLSAAPQLEVVSARFGAGDRTVDVSGKLREEFTSSRENVIKVNAGKYGNPAPWMSKYLELKVKLDGVPRTLWIREGCQLPADPAAWDKPPYRVPDIQQQVIEAYRKGEKRVKLTPGVHRLSPAGQQKFHLFFAGLEDFEIDATGCTFLFEDPDSCGILFQDCRNVTLRGARLLRETPPFSQGSVCGVGKDYVDVDIHTGYPDDLTVPQFKKTPVINFYGQDRIIKPGFDGELNVKSIRELAPGRYRFTVSPAQYKTVQIGDLAAWRRRAPMMVWGELNVYYCSSVKIEDVLIRNSISVAVREVGGEGGHYYRYSVTYADPPEGATEKPLLSSAADGFYSGAVRRGPVLEKCLLEGMHDDGVNIHGKFWKVENVDGRKLVVNGTPAPPEIGDLLDFHDEKHLLIASARVAGVFRTASSKMGLEMDRELPAECRSMVNTNASGSGFVLRDNVTRNHRGRGFLVRGKDGLIEGNVFEDLVRCAIIAQPEYLQFNEGPYVENLIIRNNTIRRCPADCWGTGAAVSISSLQTMNWEAPGRGPWLFVPAPGGHRNVRIEDNVFEECDGINILVACTDGAVVRGNRMIRPMRNFLRMNRHDGLPARGALIQVLHSRNVTVGENLLEEPSSQFKEAFVAGPEVSELNAENACRIVQ